MSFSQPNTTRSMFWRRSSGDLSGPSWEFRYGTSPNRALVKGNRSMCLVRSFSSGLRSTSLRRWEEVKREDVADDVDFIEILSRDAPIADEVPDENTVVFPELLDDLVAAGLS